jgi:aspartate aminotransferase/aminotransferase
MNLGKPHIHNLPANDITSLGITALHMQREAESRGITLPPPVRLHVGEPSFRTPEHIRQAAIETIERETLTYGPPAGWPWLRELLAEKIARVNGYEVRPANVAVSMGGTGAIQAALLATVGAGDEVLIPDPHWPHYMMQLASCGATYVPYPLDPRTGWLPDIAQLGQLVTPRTRLLLINSPGNPTGAVFSPQLVAELLDFARRHDLYLLSDECYDEIVFEGWHTSPASLLSYDEFNEGRVICVYSFSKSYAMTGWRIGYVVTGEELLKTITHVLDGSHTNISTAIQRAAEAALIGPQGCVGEMREAYRQRRDLAVRLLQEHGRYLYTPHGAFYLLIDITNPDNAHRQSRQFTLDLLRERNVTAASGASFGSAAEQYVRISLAASEEEIERGVQEICLFAER